MNRRSPWLPGALLFGAILISAPPVRADSVTFTGNLTSDSTAVSSTDPVITNPATINSGDAFSLLLTYNPASFMLSGNSYVLTDATATLMFDGYTFAYNSGGGNYLEFSTPGVFGAGTVSFLICASLADCSTTDFINLYFAGTVASLSTLAAQAGGLSGDASASPSEFEFLRNITDGSQTDLQGTLGTPSGQTAVPEPAALVLLMSGVVPLWGMGLRRRRDL